jgi:hypothetical protein
MCPDSCLARSVEEARGESHSKENKSSYLPPLPPPPSGRPAAPWRCNCRLPLRVPSRSPSPAAVLSHRSRRLPSFDWLLPPPPPPRTPLRASPVSAPRLAGGG